MVERQLCTDWLHSGMHGSMAVANEANLSEVQFSQSQLRGDKDNR